MAYCVWRCSRDLRAARNIWQLRSYTQFILIWSILVVMVLMWTHLYLQIVSRTRTDPIEFKVLYLVDANITTRLLTKRRKKNKRFVIYRCTESLPLITGRVARCSSVWPAAPARAKRRSNASWRPNVIRLMRSRAAENEKSKSMTTLNLTF